MKINLDDMDVSFLGDNKTYPISSVFDNAYKQWITEHARTIEDNIMKLLEGVHKSKITYFDSCDVKKLADDVFHIRCQSVEFVLKFTYFEILLFRVYTKQETDFKGAKKEYIYSVERPSLEFYQKTGYSKNSAGRSKILQIPRYPKLLTEHEPLKETSLELYNAMMYKNYYENYKTLEYFLYTISRDWLITHIKNKLYWF